MNTNKTDIKVIHVFANGTETKSITGHIIPTGHPIYNYLADFIMNRSIGA